MSGQRLKLTAVYENDQLDTTTVAAGRCDPKLRVSQPPLPKLSDADGHGSLAGAGWLRTRPGRATFTSASRGCRARPRSRGRCSATRSEACGSTARTTRAVSAADASAEPFTIKPHAERKSIDVFFPPYRDESKSTMTLRLIAADGRSSIVDFPGRKLRPGKRSGVPEPTQATAKPGDDLQSLVDRFGSVTLSAGNIPAEPAARAQPARGAFGCGRRRRSCSPRPASEAPWSSAIKIHCGNTTLSGFAVRFEGPIRWNNDVEYGPAVIGMTDNFDRGHDDPKFNVVFKHLDLEIPAAANPAGWVDSLRLMRLYRAKSGVIEGNILRGGMIEFFDGPWRIVDNDFRGTPPGSYSHAVFAGHGTHDLSCAATRPEAIGPSGKTWRFLVLTWFGADDVVEGNTIEQVGARDDDTIPWSNEPEIILTEAYHLKYEGKVMALSKDGRVLRTGPSLGDSGSRPATSSRS